MTWLAYRPVSLRTAPSQSCRDYSLSFDILRKCMKHAYAMGALRLLSRVDAACCGTVSGYGGGAQEVFSVPHPRHEAQRRLAGATITAAFVSNDRSELRSCSATLVTAKKELEGCDAHVLCSRRCTPDRPDWPLGGVERRASATAHHHRRQFKEAR